MLKRYSGMSLVETAISLAVLGIAIAGTAASITVMTKSTQQHELISNKTSLDAVLSRYINDSDLIAKSALLAFPEDASKKAEIIKNFNTGLSGNAQILFCSVGVPQKVDPNSVDPKNPTYLGHAKEDFIIESELPEFEKGNACRGNTKANQQPSLQQTKGEPFRLLDPTDPNHQLTVDGKYFANGKRCSNTENCDLEVKTYVQANCDTGQSYCATSSYLELQFEVIPIKLSATSAQLKKFKAPLNEILISLQKLRQNTHFIGSTDQTPLSSNSSKKSPSTSSACYWAQPGSGPDYGLNYAANIYACSAGDIQQSSQCNLDGTHCIPWCCPLDQIAPPPMLTGAALCTARQQAYNPKTDSCQDWISFCESTGKIAWGTPGTYNAFPGCLTYDQFCPRKRQGNLWDGKTKLTYAINVYSNNDTGCYDPVAKAAADALAAAYKAAKGKCVQQWRETHHCTGTPLQGSACGYDFQLSGIVQNVNCQYSHGQVWYTSTWQCCIP